MVNFDGTDGSLSQFTSPVQGIDGNLYGTTDDGGGSSFCGNGCGTVYRLTPQGELTTIYSFCEMTGCPDGGDPLGALVLGRDGNFYGTTNGGGGIGPYGTVFKITADGKLTTLHSFGGPIDGSNPYGALVQSIDGNFYGTTSRGGPNANGTVFKITPNGVLTTLYSFCAQGQCADGATPFAGLVQASDGNFYGTSYGGGNHSCLGGCGTVFRISPVGTLTTLYSFNSDSGSGPYGGLMQAIDGYIYGTTGSGPSNFSGTVFRFTLGGKFATVHRFNQTDGAGPMAGLIQGSDGSLYGTTALGGAGNGVGSVFMIASGGKLTTLHSFDGTDGFECRGQVVQATNGVFYGTTYSGGANADGTAFSLSTGLRPFVAFVQAAGKVGQTGGILGQGFTGTTSVLLNGIPATFKVISDTFIEATVPAGATTGYVTVATPSGKLTSNVPFHVIR